MIFFKEQWFLILLTTAMGFFGYGGKVWLDKRKAKEKEKKVRIMIDGLRSIATVYTCMQNVYSLEGIDLVYLLEISNDGNIPRAGSKIFARLIEIKTHPDSKKNRNYFMQTYGEFRIDEQYINMVLEAKHTQVGVEIKRDKMPACLLKNILLSESIDYVEYYHVYSDTDKWRQYIIGIATKDKTVRHSEFTDAMIENNITQIRYNFNEYR